MALIKCPECGKDISDKAQVCINCGYPISDLNKNELYSLTLVGYSGNKKSMANARSMAEIFLKNDYHLSTLEAFQKAGNLPYTFSDGLTYENAQFVKNKFERYNCVVEIKQDDNPINLTENEKISSQIQKMNAPVTCPCCGSTSITTGQRGFSLVTGLIGSNKTVNRCGKCGYTWNP